MNDIHDILVAPDTFTTTLLTICIDRYGSECLEWDPLVLAMELQRDFGVSMPAESLDRLQAGATVMLTNMYFQNLESFVSISNSMNFQSIAKDNFIPADVDDMAWTATEIHLLLGQDYKDMVFSPQVALYAGTVLQQEGILKPPSVLAFAIYPEQPLSEGVDQTKDPIMYQTTWSVQSERTKEVEDRLQERMQLLFAQLKELPIQSLNKKLFEKPGSA